MVLIALTDQAIKFLVRGFIGEGILSLGFLGQIRVVQTQIWMKRALGGELRRALWLLWAVAGGASAIICTMVPSFGWPFGLLLGGALSHALETTFRGSICDYVCLGWWPAFNLADVALTLGSLAVIFKILAVIS
jgi:hypothetical protein